MGTINGDIYDNVLTGGDGGDAINGLGGDDVLRGGRGADVLHGGKGHDTLWGGKGHDQLWGDNGSDKLHGDDGNDVLNGGAGFDDLWGGAGADRFLFLSTTADNQPGGAQEIDNIYDFSRAEGDKIDVSDIDANWNRDGNQAFNWIGTREFTGAAGQARYETEYVPASGGIPATWSTFVEFDVDGDRRADLTILLDGYYQLRGDDLIL